MNPRTFMRTLLLLPLLVPLLAVASGSSPIIQLFLLGSVVFGLVSYLLTAVLLWPRIGRCSSQKSAFRLMFSAPLVFALLQALAWLVYSFSTLEESGSGFATDLAVTALMALVLSFYGLLLGYFYATFAAVIFFAVTRLGLVSGFTSAEPNAAGADAV